MRLSSSDASFLYMESASGPMHISSIIVLEGELPFERIYEHFDARMHLIPAYKRRLAQVPLNLAHPEWVDDPEFDLANHVKLKQLPEDTSLEDAIDVAVELNEPMLDRSKPLWFAHVIQGVPGKTLVLHATHHALIDGASGIDLFAIMYDFDPNGSAPPPAESEWMPEPPKDGPTRFNEALRENLDKLRNTDWSAGAASLSGQSEMFRRAAKVMSDFVSKPVITAPFNAGLVGPKRRLRWMKQSFNEIREIRRAMGGTLNDVVLAVVSEAVATYLDTHNEPTTDQYMRIMCPVNVRTEDQKGKLGNQVSAIFPVLPAWNMPLEQRYAAVSAEMQRIKQNQDAQALTLMQESAPDVWPVAMWPTQLVGTPFDPTAFAAQFPLPTLPQGIRPPNVGINFVCTNVPGVQVPAYLDGHQVLDQIGLLILSGNLGFSITIISYNQTLYFGFISEPRLMPDVETVVDSAEQSFAQLLETARARTQTLRA